MPDSLEEQQFKKWLRRPTLFIASAWFLLAAAGQYILPGILNALTGLFSLFGVRIAPDVLNSCYSVLYEAGVLALPVACYAAKREGVSQSMRLNRPKMKSILTAVLTACIGVYAANSVGIWWLLLLERMGGTLYEASVPIPGSGQELIFSIAVVGIVPGICEELFFRGGMMGAWERKGTKKALVITSILFTLLHGSIQGFPAQLMMGFVLGYILLLTDSLYVSMAYHAAHNSLTMILTYLGQAGGAQTADPYAGLTAYIASSGGYGMLAAETALTVLLFCGMLLIMTRLHRSQVPTLIKIRRGDDRQLTWQELLVVIIGIMTVCAGYFSDYLRIFTVLSIANRG